MVASRDSMAYKQTETSLRKEETIESNLHEVRQTRRQKRKKIRLSAFSCLAIIVIVAVYVLVCQMRLTQLTAEVYSQTEKLDELTAESVSLANKKTYNVDMTAVEERASKELGMVKMDASQIEYIEITNPDNIVIASNNVSLESLFSGLARSFSAVVEYIN